MEQLLQIKGMVCSRCIAAIKGWCYFTEPSHTRNQLGKISFSSELQPEDENWLEMFLQRI